MKCHLCFLVLWMFSPMLLAQGLVNVNNRGLSTPQLVMVPRSWPPWSGGSSADPLVGTQWVAQIVYGPSNLPLGDLMPFRVATTTAPGTWNPGAQAIRTLEGFDVGANVTMQVRVWDSSVFSSWAEAEAALARGTLPPSVTATFAGASAPFIYTVGSSTNPVSLTLQNFQGFTLTTISCLCPPPPPPPCYIEPAPVGFAVLWNGADTNINLLPLLGAYLGADRPASAVQWTSETPVERLFQNSQGTRPITDYFEISGTLGSARFVSRTNVLGTVGALMSPDIGYESYVNGGRRVCGVQAGWLGVGVYRPPVLGWLPPVADRVTLRIEGMPDTRYRILCSDSPGNFAPWTVVTTGANGLYQGLSISRDGPSATVFIRAEEAPR